jgi:hypothetical protein
MGNSLDMNDVRIFTLAAESGSRRQQLIMGGVTSDATVPETRHQAA